MPLPAPQKPHHPTSLIPLFHWLRTPLGRTWVQTLVFVLAFQGLPFSQLPWHPPGGAFVARLADQLGLLLPSAQDATAVFGPEDFLRSTGRPVTIVRTFPVSDPSGTFTLCIDNAGKNDEYGLVSSAEVH